MVFYSKLVTPPVPTTDVFNFIFHEGRENYSAEKVLYRVHETGETLTLSQLEEQSRRFASVLTKRYAIKPNDVVTFLANNSVGSN
jgi:acyl-coenzyme A synthetase/AMP-(fatty) acid ligase